MSGVPRALIEGRQAKLAHLRGVWDDASLYLQGRTVRVVPQLHLLLTTSNPFREQPGSRTWAIHDRYEATGTVNETAARRHCAAATAAVGVLESARLSGILS